MTVILDASALMAFLLEEPGHEVVIGAGPDYAMSTVNFGEVLTKVVERGGAISDVEEGMASLSMRLFAFEQADAIEVALLRPVTRALGRSFGDRACLALGRRLGLPMLTAEHRWAELDLGIDIRLIR